MDIIEINKFTQKKKVSESFDKMYSSTLNKEDALRLLIHASKCEYGTMKTVKILHALGVDRIDLSL